MNKRIISARRIVVPVLLGLSLLLAGFLIGAGFSSVQAGPNTQEDDREELFAPFWETWDLLHQSYVEELDDVVLMEGALNGMMETLGDEHSFYMDPESFAIVNTDLEGQFEGIGAVVRQDEESGALVIVSTMPDAPAEASGLRGGDAIVQVDGVDITTLTQSEIISRVRGPAGTAVELGIMREGAPEMLVFEVQREQITLQSVYIELLEEDIVYLQLTRFAGTSAQELRDALVEVNVEQRSGLILDVRGNPGGYLSTAIDVVSEFLPEGLILTERFREGERVYEATGQASAPTVPLVILVDEGSASASEIVAGSLQDQQRAVIVGTTTYGKGSVQTWRALSNGGGVRVTIALWYTPDDNSLSGVGLTPDVEVLADPAGSDEDVQLQRAVDVLKTLLEQTPEEDKTITQPGVDPLPVP